MNDDSIMDKIAALVEREHRLRRLPSEPSADERGESGDLRAVEIELDQCWDLLRQRRAKRDYGDDPDTARPRSSRVVEGYWQ